jgi:uncharacterized protein YecE (DUF72 family)
MRPIDQIGKILKTIAMAKIYIGTSGYSYKDWVGPFYPEDTPENAFLAYYAAQFPFVELNFSYYSMPNAPLIEKLIEKTPPGFLFAVKAHKSITHEITDQFEKEVASFQEGIAPLTRHQRLAAVLVQFPYRFHYTPPNRLHLDRLTRLLAGLPLAIEFRNDEWLQEKVREELKNRNASFVNVDQPALPRLMKPGGIVTGDPAYIRFHGRNGQNWWKGDNVTRYDYFYSDEELAGWIEHIRTIVNQVKVLLVSFNNHSRGQAIRNAKKLKELLAAENMEVS